MSDLLAELAGVSFAEQYSSVNVTGCRIKKEDMSMSVDLESDTFPCELPFAKLRAAIRERFRVEKIAFNIRYIDFKITDNNKKALYDNIRDYVSFKKPELLKVMTNT